MASNKLEQCQCSIPLCKLKSPLKPSVDFQVGVLILN